MKQLFAVVLVAALGAAPVAAEQVDARTLADIRAELQVMQEELGVLRRELEQTEGQRDPETEGSLFDRISAIESELQRLTGKTESLELRIERIVADGTNRLGDLQFRLTELEGGDISELGQVPALGGEAPGDDVADSGDTAVLRADEAEDREDAPAMAVGEQGDFDSARDALEDGEYERAEEMFAAFVQTYPGGPLTTRAHVLRAEALDALGQDSRAARAWLDAYSAEPHGRHAPQAMYRLGLNLEALDQPQEACVMFFELEDRFPESDFAPRARNAAQDIGCE